MLIYLLHISIFMTCWRHVYLIISFVIFNHTSMWEHVLSSLDFKESLFYYHQTECFQEKCPAVPSPLNLTRRGDACFAIKLSDEYSTGIFSPSTDAQILSPIFKYQDHQNPIQSNLNPGQIPSLMAFNGGHIGFF